MHKGSGVKKILVLEDELMVGEIICQMLQHLDFGVVCVQDGSAAIEEYRKKYENGEGYVAAILDLTVPGGIGGEETSREILAINRQAKIFVTSGYNMDPVMVNYQDYGFSGAIEKPFDLAKITQIFSSFL